MVYLRLIDNSPQAMAFLEYIKTVSFIEIINEIETKNDAKISKNQILTDIKESLEDVKANKTKPIKKLSLEEREELGLTKLMKQVDRTQKVSREKVMKKLGRK